MNENDCPICLEPIKDEGYIVLKCKHKMDLDCYFGCEKNKINKCPLCRAIINEYWVEEENNDYLRLTIPDYNFPRGDMYSDFTLWNPELPIYPTPEISYDRNNIRRRRNTIPYNFSIPIAEYEHLPRRITFATTHIQDLILDKVFLNYENDVSVNLAVIRYNSVMPSQINANIMQINLDILFDEGYIRKRGSNYRRIV